MVFFLTYVYSNIFHLELGSKVASIKASEEGRKSHEQCCCQLQRDYRVCKEKTEL